MAIYLPGLGVGKGESEEEKYIKLFHLLTIKYNIAFLCLFHDFPYLEFLFINVKLNARGQADGVSQLFWNDVLILIGVFRA